MSHGDLAQVACGSQHANRIPFGPELFIWRHDSIVARKASTVPVIQSVLFVVSSCSRMIRWATTMRNPGRVETQSRHYQIECLTGHPHFRSSGVLSFSRARSTGRAFENEGTLDLGRIECGMRFRFLLEDDLRVRTSSVLSVHVVNP